MQRKQNKTTSSVIKICFCNCFFVQFLTGFQRTNGSFYQCTNVNCDVKKQHAGYTEIKIYFNSGEVDEKSISQINN